ncbi:Conserved_hypothetical protein [Hexamita inflata]|uniref:PX domain-containing protein n=1 Tax=Hexamita inflata TaxID=28002 RepID=A0ABP1JEC2_9EUKA
MLAHDDLQHLILSSDQEQPLPIEIQSVQYDPLDREIINYSIVLTSPQEFPIAKQKSVVVTIQAKAFLKFSQLCSYISICPVFPEALVSYEGELSEDYVKQVGCFFKLVMQYATTDQYIRQSFALRTLLCKPNEQSYQELSSSVSDRQKQKILTSGKVSTVATYELTKKSFLGFTKNLKNKMADMVNKDDTTVVTTAEQMESVSNTADKTQQQMSEEELFEYELKLLDKQLNAYVTFITAQIQIKHNQINSVREFTSNAPLAALYQQLLPSWVSQAKYLIQFVKPILQIGADLSSSAFTFLNEFKSASLDLQMKLEKLGSSQQKLASTQKSDGQAFQKATENMNDCIQRSEEAKREKIQQMQKQKYFKSKLDHYVENELKIAVTEMCNMEASHGLLVSQVMNK